MTCVVSSVSKMLPALLQQHRDALDPAPGVDVLGGQRCERTVVAAVELHEDEVPELEEAVAVAPGLAVGPAAAVLHPAVVVELRAGPHGPVAPAFQKLSSPSSTMRCRGDALLEPEVARDVVGRELVVALVSNQSPLVQQRLDRKVHPYQPLTLAELLDILIL